MNKNRRAPKHIYKRKGNHPQSELKLIQILEKIDGPRGPSCHFVHPLTTIFFIAIICSLYGADHWEVVVIQARAMVGWLGEFVDVSNRIPCVRTFKRVFEAIAPQQLERMFREIADLWGKKRSVDVISFDGKTLRGTSASECGLQAIHMLNAWSHENGICIGSIKIE